MDSRWFKEDRGLVGEDQVKAIEESKKALANSTFFSRRLKTILEEELALTYREDEDFDNPQWHNQAIANAATRKTLKNIIKLIS